MTETEYEGEYVETPRVTPDKLEHDSIRLPYTTELEDGWSIVVTPCNGYDYYRCDSFNLIKNSAIIASGYLRWSGEYEISIVNSNQKAVIYLVYSVIDKHNASIRLPIETARTKKVAEEKELREKTIAEAEAALGISPKPKKWYRFFE